MIFQPPPRTPRVPRSALGCRVVQLCSPKPRTLNPKPSKSSAMLFLLPRKTRRTRRTRRSMIFQPPRTPRVPRSAQPWVVQARVHQCFLFLRMKTRRTRGSRRSMLCKQEFINAFFFAHEDQKDQRIQKIDDIPASTDSTGAKVCTAMGCASKSSSMLSFFAHEDQKDQRIQKIDDIPASTDSTKVCTVHSQGLCKQEFSNAFFCCAGRPEGPEDPEDR